MPRYRAAIPAVPGHQYAAPAYAHAVLRIITGVLVASHGVRKLIQGPVAAIGEAISKHGLPNPDVLAWAVTLGELAGAALALGLLTRVAGAIIAMAMASILFFVQRTQLEHLGSGAGVVAEYPLLLAVLALFYAVTGAGIWSIDRR